MSHSRSSRSNPRGFTMVELLVVISIIAILAALLLPIFGTIRQKARNGAAKQTLNAIVMALEKYREDFESSPPDNAPTTNGSEVLWYHLCRRMYPMVKTSDGRVVQGEVHHGPYLEAKDTVVPTTGDNKKLISPLGGDYGYVLMVDSDGQKRSCLVVDPGPDKLLGGQLTPDKGFVPGGGDQNGDGKPDDEDNIYSTAQIKK